LLFKEVVCRAKFNFGILDVLGPNAAITISV